MGGDEVALDVAAIRLGVPDLGGRAVDPIEPLFLDVPERAFAQMVLRIDDQSNFDHGAPLHRQSLPAGWLPFGKPTCILGAEHSPRRSEGNGFVITYRRYGR